MKRVIYHILLYSILPEIALQYVRTVYPQGNRRCRHNNAIPSENIKTFDTSSKIKFGVPRILGHCDEHTFFQKKKYVFKYSFPLWTSLGTSTRLYNPVKLLLKLLPCSLVSITIFRENYVLDNQRDSSTITSLHTRWYKTM